MSDEDRTAARRAGEPENWDQKVLADLMATPQGRFWMERLLDICGAHRPVYAHDGDALGMAFRDGQADVGRYLETQLEEHCPDLMLRMIRERRARFARQQKNIEREQQRRDAEAGTHSGVTSLEELADRQRAEDEARAAQEAAKRK